MAHNMKEKYESLSLAVLRDVAKSRGIKGTSTMRKEAVIQVMLAEDEKERAAESVKAQAADSGRTVADMEQLDSGQTVTGILEVMADGFGFIRSDHYRVCPDGAWKSSGEDYDRHRYAADQWTWHNERYPGAFAERFHFRNDQYHEFDAGSCRNCIRYGACDDHAERCISGRLYFKSQYTNPADILYDCLYWICILV